MQRRAWLIDDVHECDYSGVRFEDELARVLPAEIPHRERLIEKSSQHLRMIVSANEHVNLTRITDASEAAIKHVYDSVIPWRHFQLAGRVLDAGTGPGFPGVPLAIVLPEVRFTLAESIQKKARFVDSVVESLELANVDVKPERAEEVAAARQFSVITARALAPIARVIDLFMPALKRGARIVLYKGLNVDAEISAARKHKRAVAEVLSRYELPHGFGARAIVELKLL